MTKQRRGLLHRRDSTKHFLFSKTDSKSVKRKQIQPRESTWKIINQIFPEVLTGKRFIDHAMAWLKSAEKFGAMAVKIDHFPRKEEKFDRYKKMAQILDRLCKKEKGLWGLLEPGILDCFILEKDASDCLELARSFQKTVLEQTTETVTIGIAEYPTLTYQKQQLLDNTRKALEHAAFFGPQSAVVFDAVSLNISGDQLYEKGDIQGAIEEFKRALALEPSNVNVHNSLGVCYGVLGDYNMAQEEFKAAINLDAEESMAVYNLGLINMLTGHRDEALELFLKANRSAADVFEIVYQTGRLYLAKGESQSAQKFFEQASRLKPKVGAIYRYLGECHAAMGQIGAAIAAYKKAIKQNPVDAAALSALGCLFDQQDENPEIALMFCRESVGLSPDNGLFRLRLGQLYLKQNQFDEALKEFKKATRLGQDATGFIEKINNREKAKAS